MNFNFLLKADKDFFEEREYKYKKEWLGLYSGSLITVTNDFGLTIRHVGSGNIQILIDDIFVYEKNFDSFWGRWIHKVPKDMKKYIRKEVSRMNSDYSILRIEQKNQVLKEIDDEFKREQQILIDKFKTKG